MPDRGFRTVVRDKRVLNVIPSSHRERDWPASAAIDAGRLDGAARPPRSKDLRESWWDIGNQRSTGSCVGWASADSVLRWHFVKAGRLGQNEKLSVRFAWMASKEIDAYIERPTGFIELAGTSIKSSLDVARKYGAVKETVLKFTPPTLYTGDIGDFYTLASAFRIGNYYDLTFGVRGNTPATWRRWIAEIGPILTRLDCDDTWFDAKKTGGRLETYLEDTADGGHAVAIVGYEPGYFIVRNSWGTGWGDKGFGYASEAYALEAFTEAYGVLVA